MSMGSGIAVAAIWLASAVIAKDKRVTGIGMLMVLTAAVGVTVYVSIGGKP